MALAEPLIEIRAATFRYGRREVFKGLDLDVFRGELLSILGPNGCGKSTLLKCIGGALTLDSGTARLDRTDIVNLGARARARRVGFLFQNHTPSFPFPVLDIVSMGRAPHLGMFGVPSGADIALCEEALARVGILHLKHRPYTEVSGGERQLVLLARTLAQQPDVILLDEPTSHLDLKNQVRCLKTIVELASHGVTMIMTTHDPNHALQFQGRVVLMRPGGAIVAGPGSEVVTEDELSAIYGIDIGLYSVPRRTGPGRLTLANPW